MGVVNGAIGETSSAPGLAMDVVNGKIVDTVIVTGTETIRSGARATTTATSGGERRSMAEQQYAWSGMKASRGLGLVADARADSGRPQQTSAGGLVQWAPTWAASGMYVGDDSLSGAAVSAGSAPAAPRWNPRLPERGGRGAHDFTGTQDQHRQGWKRAADQESSRIAEFARDHIPQALGLKPSRARAVEGGSAFSVRDQLPGSFARAAAAEWAPTWAPTWVSSGASFEPMAGSRLVVNAAARSGADNASPRQPDHRKGWKWTTSSPKRSNSGPCCPRCGTMDQQRQHHFDASPCSEGNLDEEMTQFELQLTRTVSGNFSNRTSVTSSRCPEISEAIASAVTDAGDNDTSSAQKKVEELATATSSALVTVPTAALKRKRSGLSDGEVQGEWGWTQPLKLLVRKGLTVSDVGELGRIIVPKKDAESQCFPQIDTKEGRVLEMEDFTACKRWYFRFKYWINNKSRMYVLENTGDFIKFHCLKEHDTFVIYEDGCKKLIHVKMHDVRYTGSNLLVMEGDFKQKIVCGQKKENGDSLDPVLERSKSSITETPPPTTTTTEDESSRRHRQPTSIV